MSNRSMQIVAVPTNFAGTEQALALLSDQLDWSPIFPWIDPAVPHMTMIFDAPIREVQVYARHTGEKLTVKAFRGGDEVAHTSSTRQNAIVAVHDPDGIDRIEITGQLRLLYKVDFGQDYLAHGTHCHIVYDLVVGPPAMLLAPDHVTATALRGIRVSRATASHSAKARSPIHAIWLVCVGLRRTRPMRRCSCATDSFPPRARGFGRSHHLAARRSCLRHTLGRRTWAAHPRVA